MRTSSATEELLAAIAKERANAAIASYCCDDSLQGMVGPDRGILSNSQHKPKYSLTVTLVIGSVILVCMFTGVYLAVRYGW